MSIPFLLLFQHPASLGSSPNDWRTYISVVAPYVEDSGDVVSLGDRYFLSLGAHATHQHLLMDRAGPELLMVEKTFTACALVAFATDSPVVPGHSEEQTQYTSPDLKVLRRTFKRAGLRSTTAYFESLATAAESVSHFVEIGLRRPTLPMRVVPYGGRDDWPYLCWPKSAATWQALTAYWSGLVSVSLPSRILNFWRAMEAVTKTAQRYEIFADLQQKRVTPVRTRLRTVPERIVDSALILKRLTQSRRKTLISQHGGTGKALDWLYWERRGHTPTSRASTLKDSRHSEIRCRMHFCFSSWPASRLRTPGHDVYSVKPNLPAANSAFKARAYQA